MISIMIIIPNVPTPTDSISMPISHFLILMVILFHPYSPLELLLVVIIIIVIIIGCWVIKYINQQSI